jgi:hypothetical protein
VYVIYLIQWRSVANPFLISDITLQKTRRTSRPGQDLNS